MALPSSCRRQDPNRRQHSQNETARAVDELHLYLFTDGVIQVSGVRARMPSQPFTGERTSEARERVRWMRMLGRLLIGRNQRSHLLPPWEIAGKLEDK